jgi:PIN domain nuclease of toxin-antitoxin system
VKVLLDTHILLWWLANDPHLPPEARGAITDPATEIRVSAASAWEIAVKRSAGRLEAPDDLGDALAHHGFDPLAITVEHALTAGSLPLHHRDPFDRMLIAQAQVESLILITVDPGFAHYEVDLLVRQ